MESLYVLSGLAVGLLVGMTGVGGGALMTPLLVLGFNISPLVAVGTDLLFAAVTKSIGTVTHGWQGTVQWNIVGLMALGSIPSTFITINFLSDLQAQGEVADLIIKNTLASALLLTATLLIFKNNLTKYFRSHPTEQSTMMQSGFTILAGVGLGVLVTISSIGSGALGIVILTLLYPHKETVKIVGTDIAHAVPLTAIAGAGHYHLGSVDLDLLFWLLLGSIPGVYIGSRLGKKLPEKFIRYILATLLFSVSIKLLA